MPGSLRFSLALAAAAVAWLSASNISPELAQALPITVNLRVEGSTATLYEGPISTEAILPPGISTKSSGGSHPCDVKDNGENGGFGSAAASPTAALYAATTSTGLAFDASWSEKPLNDFFVSQVGSDINGGAPEFPSWGYAVNYTTAGVGGCQFQLAPGSEVLWAYNYFNLTHLLSLSMSGPAIANAGTPFTVRVADGQTGEAISGAAIGIVVGGTTTNIPASQRSNEGGNATIVLSHTGMVTLKATRAGSVRSNGLTVCVHAGADGSCGTTVAPAGSTTSSGGSQVMHPTVVAEIAEIRGLKSGRVYTRARAPRVLSGRVLLSQGATLSQVRIRLERRYRGKCFNFSGSSERFVRAARCAKASFFSVGGAESFSYLLPAALPRGRYVYDMEAIDAAGHITRLVDGVSHVVFRVK
jgi:hypothetical protein